MRAKALAHGGAGTSLLMPLSTPAGFVLHQQALSFPNVPPLMTFLAWSTQTFKKAEVA